MRARALCLSLILVLLAWSAIAADKPDGKELFTREWLPGDARSAAGDGLGPVFNDTSCVACHNQGGVGGAGPSAKNAQVASAFGAAGAGAVQTFSFGPGGFKIEPDKKSDRAAAKADKKDAKDRAAREREQLEKLHPSFLASRSVVVQRFSTDDEYTKFRENVLTRGSPFQVNDYAKFYAKFAERMFAEMGDLPNLNKEQSAELKRMASGMSQGLSQHDLGDVVLLMSERNTPALFGSGLIDEIPDIVIVAAAKKKHPGYPEVSGRVAKLKDGQVGRFGWKAQKGKLHDFVLNACATELGLEVPGQSQALSPHKPDYKAPGLDLTEEQCRELTSFVAHLPAPREMKASDEKSRGYLRDGRKLFESVGCAACHTPELGEVNGIYSDLLLHDMGQALSDAGAYGAGLNPLEDEEVKLPLPRLTLTDATAKPLKAAEEAKLIGATRQEWRTPPLWGLRDSAPYLHDGRAATIEQAIALHDGEAQRSMRQFFKLSSDERLQLQSFLRSLAAPE